MSDDGYREWAARPSLVDHLGCLWIDPARRDDGGPPSLVTPDGCLDLIWNGERLFVAGPDTVPVAVARSADGWFAGARFRPGMAATMLGVPSSVLVDDRVDLDELLPDLADTLGASLATATTERVAATMIEAALAGRVVAAAPPDQLVLATVALLRGAPRSRPVSSIADELGVSERQLNRRCTAAVGYGPKLLDRVLRYRRFTTLLARSPNADLAQLAATAGYADQAHLTRECRALAGTTPGALAAA